MSNTWTIRVVISATRMPVGLPPGRKIWMVLGVGFVMVAICSALPQQLDTPECQEATKQDQREVGLFFHFVGLHQQLFGYQVEQGRGAEGQDGADGVVRDLRQQQAAGRRLHNLRPYMNKLPAAKAAMMCQG